MTQNPPRFRPWIWVILALVAVTGIAGASRNLWLPWVRGPLSGAGEATAGADEHEGHDHEGHDSHSEDASIKVSANALSNIGYEPLVVEIGAFVRSITMPAMVVERPGRSTIYVVAPVTGVVTEIYPVQGAAIEPGSPLFEMRITHEEIVGAQQELLSTVENLDVVNRELERLRSLSEGVVPGKRILDLEYEQQQLQAKVRAAREAMALHGLSEEYIEGIVNNRQLLQAITVYAPVHSHQEDVCTEAHLFHVQSLPVTVGQQLEMGQTLCVLADHCELYIEGRAFEDDATHLREAAREGWDISASLLAGDSEVDVVRGLKLLYMADHIDPQSRAFRFYLSLPNTIALDQTGPSGYRFIEWKFKPGQRFELHVPYERWEEEIVLPVDAVVEEGPETYVYQQNGDHFERVPVHVKHREQNYVVVANNGSIFPGDVIAARGAYQIHLALKNKGGGAVDPHAGHNH